MAIETATPRVPLVDMRGHPRLNLATPNSASELDGDKKPALKLRRPTTASKEKLGGTHASDTKKHADQVPPIVSHSSTEEPLSYPDDTPDSYAPPSPYAPVSPYAFPAVSSPMSLSQMLHSLPQASTPTSLPPPTCTSPYPSSVCSDSEADAPSIHPSEADEYLLRVAPQVPLDAGHKTEIWRAGREVGACIIEHFLRYQDPTRWRSAGIHNAAAYLTTNLKNLRRTLSANIPVCQMLSALRQEREDIALCIDGRTLQSLAARLQGMHPAVVLGCQAFLARVLRTGWEQGVDNPRAKVQSIVNDYLNLVNLVKHLPLDGSHWGHLWGGGERIARCIIQHYLQHENPSQWEQRGIRQPANHLRRNIQNLRDMLMGSPLVCDMLLDLAAIRYDIAVCIDSRTMQFLANRLRSAHPRVVHECKEYMVRELRVGWAGGLRNPRAAVLSVARRYFEDFRAREVGAMAPGMPAGVGPWPLQATPIPMAPHPHAHPELAIGGHMAPAMFHTMAGAPPLAVPVSLPPGSLPIIYHHHHHHQ